jgi:hypothetical protein
LDPVVPTAAAIMSVVVAIWKKVVLGELFWVGRSKGESFAVFFSAMRVPHHPTVHFFCYI